MLDPISHMVQQMKPLKPKRSPDLTQTQKDQIDALYDEGNLYMSEIATRVGCSALQVRYHIYKRP